MTTPAARLAPHPGVRASPPLRRPVARQQRRRDALVLVGPAVAYLVVFSVFPLLYSLAISFFDYEVQQSRFTFVGLQQYASLLRDEIFWEAMGNTGLMVTVGVAAQVLLGTLLALFFGMDLKGSRFVRAILILPMILNPIVVGLLWRALLNQEWGIVNYGLSLAGIQAPNWLGDPDVAIWTLILADTWQWTPFVFVVVFARLQALATEIYEAARVDGAASIAMLRHITLPLLRPAILFAAIFRGIDAFRSFDIVFGLTYGGPGRSTTTLSFYSFESGFSFTRYGFASCLAYVMVILAGVGMTLLLKRVQVRREDAT